MAEDMDLRHSATEDIESKDCLAPNVRSLKMFFQNQKQPIIGFKTSDNPSESSVLLPQNSSKILSKDSSEANVMNRVHRLIPRPPKSIESSDITDSPLLRSLVRQRPVPSIPPIPKPRKSLLKNKSIDDVNNDLSSDIDLNGIQRTIDDIQRTNSLILSITKEFNHMNACERNPRTLSLHYLPKLDQNIKSSSIDPKPDDSRRRSTDHTLLATSCDTKDPKSLDLDKQSSTKSRKPFKSFLKRSKLLSLRRNAQNSDKRRTKSQINESQMNIKPIKPSRSPPPPPVLHFRPPAPLPVLEANDDFYEDTLTVNTCNAMNGYELYNDSVETEQIYCSLDNEDQIDDHYEGIQQFDHYDDGLTDHKYATFDDNYYEESFDSNRIYEVLPFERDGQTDDDSIVSDDSTNSLDNKIDSQTNGTLIEANIENSSKNEEKFNTFDRKQNLKAIKLKKKFNLNGNEIPVNAGVVKEDQKGNKYDLYVRKGETVLILRMEGNPPGKWLAKNERSKIGFVGLDNISFDAESVKSIIKTLYVS